ncbi:DGQHR domain-containing protein [Embleya sp. AB8]|uniref:DGQHR domain-containing protein n=1 Tax=Embleya sp. AB8 TaxID=3156304 RepID=UPI003C78D6DC
MATIVPVIRGRMGATDFYQCKMKARELVAVARPAREVDRWANVGIEERLQRELNDRRVHNEIVPYLAQSKDRFFGSIIVLVVDAKLSFESLDRITNKLHAAYRSVSEDIGFLTLDGGEFIVLDGQHRLAALREVIQSPVVEGKYVQEVPNDDLVVVFVPFQSAEHTRRIFNKVNRNAKPTGRGDNIITSEDDGSAILTRWLLREGEPLGVTDNKGELLVNWRSNTIADRSRQLTTISAVYDTVQTVLELHGLREEFDEKKAVVRPDVQRLEESYEHVKNWWLAVLEGLDALREGLRYPHSLASIRLDAEKWSLLVKPAAHIVLFRGLRRAVEQGVDLRVAVERANRLEWGVKDEIWRDVLIAPNGRIVARNENFEVSADLLGYLLSGEVMSPTDRESVRHRVARHLGREGQRAPEPGLERYELPQPIGA